MKIHTVYIAMDDNAETIEGGLHEALCRVIHEPASPETEQYLIWLNENVSDIAVGELPDSWQEALDAKD